MEIIVNKTDQFIEVNLKGDLTILSASKIKDELLELSKAANKLILKHNETTEIDLSYCQILIALKNTMKKNNKELLIYDSNELLERVAKTAGIENLIETAGG